MCENDKDGKLASIAKLVIFAGLAMIILLAMTGCGTTQPQTVYVTKEVPVPVVIPKDMLRKCAVTQFVQQKEFMAGNWKKRTELMTIYARELQADLERCNVRWPAIEKLQNDQIVIIEDKQNVR